MNDELIKEDWAISTFEDLTLSLKRGPFGGDLKKEFFVESGFPVYEQQHAIGNTFTNIRYFINESRFEKLKACNVGPGDYIVSCSGTMGKIARLPMDLNKGVINQALLRIRLNDKIIHHNYFLQFFKSAIFQKKILKDSRGSGMQNMAGIKVLKPIPVFLPPLVEQKAIVKKIEELFSSLDSGIADLKKAQDQLVIYRQAVLKKAFEGELTKEWREKQTNLPSANELLEQIKEERQKWIENQIAEGNNEAKRIKTKLTKLNPSFPEEKLPKSWKWTNFISACIFVIDCHNKTAPYEQDGIYLIRTSNVRNGKLDLINKIKYVSEATYKFWSKRVFPESGDIIFTREAPMGEATIIPNDTKICLGQRTMILRTSQKLLENKYLLYNILSEVFQQRFKKDAIGTGVKHLRVGDVESLSFPLCSSQEQHQIVREIESRLSVCDKTEESIKESLQKAVALRQSILKKAFEGKLLSVEEIEKCKADKDYEPASVLLERIRAEKEKK